MTGPPEEGLPTRDSTYGLGPARTSRAGQIGAPSHCDHGQRGSGRCWWIRVGGPKLWLPVAKILAPS